MTGERRIGEIPVGDFWTVCRFLNISPSPVLRFLGVAEMCGYELKRIKPQSRAASGEAEAV